MLESIRKRQDNIIYTGMILMIIAVMALYGVGQMGKNPENGSGTAATVNGEVITAREFQSEIERQLYQYQALFGGQADQAFLDQLQLPQRTLEQLIQYKLLAQTARKMDIIVPDNELADHIRSLPYFQKDGKFSAELYAKMPNRGLDEKMRRERLQIARLQGYLADRVVLTPFELKRAYTLRETKVNLEYAKLDLNNLGGGKKPTPKEVETFQKGTSESEFQSYYESNKKDFTHPATVHLRRIRVGIPFGAKEQQRTEAKQKIEALAKEVTVDNFATVAKKSSDDEFAKKGGDAGWVDVTALEKPIQEAIAKLDPKKISSPIDTPFGYYLVEVLERKEQTVDPLAKVKPVIAEKMLTKKLAKETFDTKRKAWDKMLEEGKSIAPELKQAKLELKKTGPFSLGQGYIPGIGQADGILDAVFELSHQNPTGKKLYPFHESYYYIRLASSELPKDADFVKGQAVAERSVSTALQTELTNQWVNSLQKNASVKTEIRLDTKAPKIN